MLEVSKPQGLVKRGNRYEYRRRVPRELILALGKTEFKRSLKTSDYREARRKSIAVAAEVERIFEAAEQHLRLQMPIERAAPLNKFEAEARVHRYVEETTAHYLADLRNRKASRDTFYEAKENATHYENPSHPLTAQNVAITKRLLFKNSDLRILPPAELDALDELIRRGLLEIEHRVLFWLRRGRRDRSFDRQFAEPAQAGISLAQLSDEYLADYKTKGKAGAKRANAVIAAHDIIKRYFGPETLVRHIDRQQCRKYVKLLAELPSNLTKHFGDRSLPLQVLAHEGKARNLPALSRNTQQTYLRALKMLLKWAVNEGHIDKNPASELEPVGRPEPANEARDPFELEELTKIFSAPLYERRFQLTDFLSGTPDKRPSRFWVPLIGCFSGMRLNEICQLKASDIRESTDGTYYFSINDESGKRLKNRFSKRSVPIHPALLEAGLLEYARSRDGGDLFPEIKTSVHGYRSDRLSRWFNEGFLPSLGLKRKKKTFHSFRHTFKDALRRVEAPQEIQDAICGWNTIRGVSNNYGKGYAVSHLGEWVRKIRFDGLSLSHLNLTSTLDQT